MRRSGPVETYTEPPFHKNAFLRHLDEQESADAVRSFHQSPLKLGRADGIDLVGLEQASTSSPSTSATLTFADELEASATTWSDFNKLYYHPKTMVEIRDYVHGDEENPFALFTQGRELFANPEFQDDFVDERLRFFAEECDSLQGFNVLGDVSDGFSGLAASILEFVRDEFPKKDILSFGIPKPLLPEHQEKNRVLNSVNLVNTGLAMNSMAEFSSMYVPLHPPRSTDLDGSGWSKYIRSNFSKPYHWTAYLACAVETVTLPYRLKAEPLLMGDLISTVNGGKTAPVAALAASIPFPVKRHSPLTTILKTVPPQSKIPWMFDLTMHLPYNLAEQQAGECAILRGVLEQAEFVTGPKSKSDLESILNSFLASFPAPSARRLVFDAGSPIDDLDVHGVIDDNTPSRGANTPGESVQPAHISVMTHMRTMPRIKELIEKTAQPLRNIGVRVAAEFSKGSRGFSLDDIKAAAEALHALAEAYDELD
ncbi:Protein misato 1 [Borealophlyctis nickersoniae]|nr:Protein misato 1 [Borealophlyctis nickersoniae]